MAHICVYTVNIPHFLWFCMGREIFEWGRNYCKSFLLLKDFFLMIFFWECKTIPTSSLRSNHLYDALASFESQDFMMQSLKCMDHKYDDKLVIDSQVRKLQTVFQLLIWFNFKLVLALLPAIRWWLSNVHTQTPFSSRMAGFLDINMIYKCISIKFALILQQRLMLQFLDWINWCNF